MLYGSYVTLTAARKRKRIIYTTSVEHYKFKSDLREGAGDGILVRDVFYGPAVRIIDTPRDRIEFVGFFFFTKVP